jgi:hypothetical protein
VTGEEKFRLLSNASLIVPRPELIKVKDPVRYGVVSPEYLAVRQTTSAAPEKVALVADSKKLGLLIPDLQKLI